MYYSENQEVQMHVVHLWPRNAYVQATPTVGSVNFCTVVFGGVFFNSFYCLPCVLPDILVSRCTKFIFCVKAAVKAAPGIPPAGNQFVSRTVSSALSTSTARFNMQSGQA
mmetsp:Transcript_61657/g.102341  ORF Transcript_61657/g.102341 Transcript_61657/m.102341 type:complete len:110 (+) Transcript_61657:138-467(+)